VFVLEKITWVFIFKKTCHSCLEVLGFPQSCAAVERSFSAVRRIHTWQRNRIGRKKLAQLMYIYLNQRALQKQEI